MRTIEEILTCVKSCLEADICDSDKHWCNYGDTCLSDCVDRLESDFFEILDVVKKAGNIDRLRQLVEMEGEIDDCVEKQIAKRPTEDRGLKMNQEDKDFLKALQHEMLTQDTLCQANPRFWVVMQTVRDYWVEDDIDGIAIYDQYAAERAFEGELKQLADWVKEEFDVVQKCEYDRGFLDIVCEDENEYCISSISEIKDFLEEYASGQYSICNYRNRAEIVQNTMFLTNRECKEHIKVNSHHYNETAHSYAMTAWRSPQVSKLYKILENTNWDEC